MVPLQIPLHQILAVVVVVPLDLAVVVHLPLAVVVGPFPRLHCLHCLHRLQLHSRVRMVWVSEDYEDLRLQTECLLAFLLR